MRLGILVFTLLAALVQPIWAQDEDEPSSEFSATGQLLEEEVGPAPAFEAASAEEIAPSPAGSPSPAVGGSSPICSTEPAAAAPGTVFSATTQAWTRIPSVLIAGPKGDWRIALVYEALDCWNRRLAAFGTPFRFGSVSETTERVADDYLVASGAAADSGVALPPVPGVALRMPGDIIVALSDAEFVSFSSPLTQGKRVVGIRKGGPLLLPNVARNLIAHELGHAMGMGHASDPALLMCWRPSPCRPPEFQSDVARFFPLAKLEVGKLLALYPPSWRSR